MERRKFDCFSTLYGSKWVATLLAGDLDTANDFVSVPSTGRSGLQQVKNRRRNCQKKWFQYPLRVEVGCNPVPEPPADHVAMFQYPLRVEVGCNPSTISTARHQ